MSYQVPTKEPKQIVAGDYVRWTKDLEDYPASDEGWILVYVLLANETGGKITITASSSGNTHVVGVVASTTEDWIPGHYHWRSYVQNGTDIYSIEEGEIDILEQFSAQTAPFDPRTQAERILQAHLDAQELMAARPESSYSLQAAGRAFTYRTHDEMIRAIEYWKRVVQQERDARDLSSGKNTGSKIYVKFI